MYCLRRQQAPFWISNTPNKSMPTFLNGMWWRSQGMDPVPALEHGMESNQVSQSWLPRDAPARWHEDSCLQPVIRKVKKPRIILVYVFYLYNQLTQYSRYETLQLRSTLSEITDFCWCLNPSCDSGQIHPQGSPNHILTCTSCNYKACTVHNIQWHEGETCEQYDYRVSGRKSRRDERATERVIQQTTKPCPNCKANIEKIAGCDHMTCEYWSRTWINILISLGLGCRTEFCWICFADYRRVRRRGNTAHDPACRYHTGNLPHG